MPINLSSGSLPISTGYWVPFEAAKAVAATFCHEIRYALTPVFGLDFPDSCTEPDDPAFLRTSIDQDIIRRCTEAANASRVLSTTASPAYSPNAPHSLAVSSQSTSKLLRPKHTKAMEVESGYGTDTDRSCPNSPYSGSVGWTPVNIPRSVPLEHCNFPTSTPATEQALLGQMQVKAYKKERKVAGRTWSELEEDSDELSSSEYCPSNAPVRMKRRKISTTPSQEARAAYTLMQLHIADAALAEKTGPKPRRASS